MHKGAGGWQARARSAACPRSPATSASPAAASARATAAPRTARGSPTSASTSGGPPRARSPTRCRASPRRCSTAAVRVLLLLGTDMLSSFADAGRVAEGLARQDLVVSYDLFLNDTARRFADVVLPATAWLEELGCKSTNTHLYLMPKVLEPPGETRPIVWVLRELARRLGLDDFFPWASDERSARRDPRSSGDRARHGGRAPRRGRHARAEHLARRASGSEVPHAVGQDRALLERARRRSGCRPCPMHEEPTATSRGIRSRSARDARSRTSTASTTTAARCRRWPRPIPEPALWISPADAAARGVIDGATIRIYNERGELSRAGAA